MQSNDIDYYRKRVVTEDAAAQACPDDTIAAVHRELAWRYRQQLARMEHNRQVAA